MLRHLRLVETAACAGLIVLSLSACTEDRHRDMREPVTPQDVGAGGERFDQGISDQDLEIRRSIYAGIDGNDNLSLAAQSVEVTTNDGRVHLEGTVRSLEEKESVEAIAARFVGPVNVTSDLVVTP